MCSGSARHPLAPWARPRCLLLRGSAVLVCSGLLGIGCSATSDGAAAPEDAAISSDQGPDDLGREREDQGGALDRGVPGDLGGEVLSDLGPDDAAALPMELPAGVVNFCHVAGLATADGAILRAGLLFRSGHLAELDEAGCATLQHLQLAAIVDLRSTAEVEALPDAACATRSVRYLVADLPKILPPSAESYASTLDAIEPKLATIFGHVAQPAGLPLLVHCVIGRDRANLVMALLLAALGIPREQILDEFVHNQAVDVDAAWLAPLFERIDRAGGVEPYLAQHGVAGDAIELLRSLALDAPG